MTGKFKVGDKVVPISKSVGGCLDEVASWDRAQADNQEFLYVCEINSDYECDYVCNNTLNAHGDFFMEKDLIPYVEEPDKIPELKAGMVVDIEDYDEFDELFALRCIIMDTSEGLAFVDEDWITWSVIDKKLVKAIYRNKEIHPIYAFKERYKENLELVWEKEESELEKVARFVAESLSLEYSSVMTRFVKDFGEMFK